MSRFLIACLTGPIAAASLLVTATPAEAFELLEAMPS
jgi:hypothetical protein